MLVARKGNKEVYVNETTKSRYLNDGYSIFEDGKLVEYGRGITISPALYQKVVEENEMLKAELAKLKAKKKKAEKN